jgi:curved DNA-binding protein
MIDYYQTLGVPKTANADDIKKAYRKLAMKYHPDRGGDVGQFQKIQEAYAVLSDDQKRAQYDNPQPQYTFNTGNFDDMFGAMFGASAPFGFQRARSNRNKSINIRVEMTLEEILRGKEIVGNIRLVSGRDQTININMPPGVVTGDSIKFQGLGDDSIPGVPRGDLIAQVVEIPHPRFQRNGKDLYMNFSVSAFDAMLGKTVRVTTLDDRQLEVNIPAGIQSEQMIKCDGYGLPGFNDARRGNLFLKIKISIPKNIFTEDKQKIEELAKRYGF